MPAFTFSNDAQSMLAYRKAVFMQASLLALDGVEAI